jgi:hypothetical protein
MKVTRSGVALAAALLAIGCSKDGGPFLAPVEPLAYTRFVAAVPDTSALDWRFVDAVKNSPFALNLAFRGFTPYQATTPGARHLRIFPTSTDITITSQVVMDTTLTFEEGKYYTIVHIGLARTGGAPADRIIVFNDDAPSLTGTTIALRAINLGPGLNTGAPGAVDVFATAATGDALPATPLFGNLAFLSASAYVTRPTGTLAVRATGSGTTTPVLANVAAPAGVPADPALSGSAIGGAAQGGTAMTAFIFPRSTAGSRAPQTAAFTNPIIVYVVDRRPL